MRAAIRRLLLPRPLVPPTQLLDPPKLGLDALLVVRAVPLGFLPPALTLTLAVAVAFGNIDMVALDILFVALGVSVCVAAHCTTDASGIADSPN